MSLDEFTIMVTNSGILEGKSMSSGDIGVLFNISMMTQVKELDFERHMEMNFLEFVEAVCRVAYKLKDFPEKYITNELMISLSLLRPNAPRKPTSRANSSKSIIDSQKVIYHL